MGHYGHTDGRHIIVASGGSQKNGMAGNTISIIDVDRARASTSHAEVARIPGGTHNPGDRRIRSCPSVTPRRSGAIVPNVRADNVSIVNLGLGVGGDPGAEVARIPLAGWTDAPHAQGSAITSDGKYAVITAGPGEQPFSEELVTFTL